MTAAEVTPGLAITEDGNLLTITLQRPERANALSTVMLAGIVDAVQRANTEDGIAAIVLTGAGSRHFSGGIDLKEAFSPDADQVSERRSRLMAALLAIVDSEIPVVAGVNGACVGAGALLTLVTDGIVAAKDVVFALPEVRIGMPARLPAAIVTATLGPGFVNRFVLGGQPLTAEEAHRAGIAELPCEPAELGARARAGAEALAAHPREAFGATKLWARRQLRAEILAAVRHAEGGGPNPDERRSAADSMTIIGH